MRLIYNRWKSHYFCEFQYISITKVECIGTCCKNSSEIYVRIICCLVCWISYAKSGNERQWDPLWTVSMFRNITTLYTNFHKSEINFLPFIINNPMLFSTIQAYSFLNFSVSKSHSRAACVYYRISVVVMDLSVISSLTKASPDG